MRKRILLYIGCVMVISSFWAVLFNDKMNAAGQIEGSPNNEAATSLTLGDQVHLGGSSMNDDMHTVLGIKDGYLYLLRSNSADNGTLNNYNNALSYASGAYKTQLGTIGSAHFSLSGNEVSLPSKTDLQNLSVVSGDVLNASISQLGDKWWLKDANTSTNRASFVSGDNSLNADGGIEKTTVSEVVYNNPAGGGNCGKASAGEKGVMPITAFNAPTVVKAKYISSAVIKFDYPDAVGISYATWESNGTCSPSATGGGVPLNVGSVRMRYTLASSGKESWVALEGEGAALPASLMISPEHNWRPRPLMNSNGTFTIINDSLTTHFTGGIGSSGTCYVRWMDKPNIHVSANTTFHGPSSIQWGTRTFNVTSAIYGTPTVTDINCPVLTNAAGSALIRPYLKVAIDDILMRNHAKRSFAPSSALSTGSFPKSDNAGEYLTLQTSTINLGLNSTISGVSGNRYKIDKPQNNTIVSLPVSFSGPMEGDRYVSAEAVDKDGNRVYGVLKAVGSSTSNSVDIDFANLLPDGATSFQVTLYLEDEGSKNTAYRSEGTPITVEFQKSTTPLSFTNPNITNVKIGGADIKESIITDNTEIATSGSNAVKYTLTGGITGTGLAVVNDPSDPKGFIISVGNTPNPSLPTDFTLTAELETTTSTKATISKQIHVFQEMTDFKWTPSKTGSFLPSEVGSNAAVGHLEVKNGLPKYVYELTSPSDSGYDPAKAKDNASFTISNTALGANQKAEVKTSTTLLPGTYQIQCKVTDAYGDELYTDFSITVSAKDQDFIYTDNNGIELPKTNDKYNAKAEAYENGKTFQLYTAGYPTGAGVTYQLKAGSPTDVISVDSNGLVHILNASMNNQMGKVIVEATSHDPSGSYSDKTIELPINIEKGTRVISFADDPIYVINGKGTVTPVTEVDGIIDSDGDVLIEVDANEDGSIAWTNDNKTIQYNYSGSDAKDIKIHATKPMDRNYKAAEADGTLHIMGPDENVLAITSPGQIIYGDHFTIRSTQYDAGSTNVQYQFEIDDTTYLSAPTVNGNIAEFDAIKYSGNKKTTIKVTRTADGETPLSKTISVQVLPKEIEITIDDKEKYKGEANPPLTYQDFKSQLVTWNGVLDVIQEHDIKLSTTAQTNSQAGNYPIKGDANSLNNTYPNYSFKFVEGTLEIKEDNIEDDWYHMEIADGSHTPYSGDWTNQDIDIISDHAEYVNLSLDQSTWNPQKVTVSKEGETNQSFWMKKDSGAITKEKQETIRIDKTPPKVKGIKAKDSNNQVQDIINTLSGGIFFQPGTAFEITTSDENGKLKASETKKISYKVYQIRNTKSDEEISNGVLSVTDEKASITISETTGTYRVCVIPTDYAGNSGEESCHEVTLKKIDVDVDDDGKPDFNDPDGDGCPDLNIKWKDPSDPNKWIIINGDRDNDGIPDLNIDSDGDGKADLNIDTDNDGKPDLNLVILKKTDSQGTPAVWKPTKCVKQDLTNGILEEYCTGTNVKAEINVDLDGDGIPDINIDNKGDFKPHINISKNGKTPSINIAILHEWNPKTDKKVSGFGYDTMTIDEKKEVLVNIDTDGDGLPDLNLDLNNDGIPDLNIDWNGDWIADTQIDTTGDGEPNINIDTDGNGIPDEHIVEIKEWKPNKNVDGDLPYDTMEINPADDTDKPQEPSEGDDPQLPTDAKNPNQQGNDSDSSVQGYYNPQGSMGGASTGDTSNLMMYMGISLVSLGIIFFAIYKKKAEN